MDCSSLSSSSVSVRLLGAVDPGRDMLSSARKSRECGVSGRLTPILARRGVLIFVDALAGAGCPGSPTNSTIYRPLQVDPRNSLRRDCWSRIGLFRVWNGYTVPTIIVLL